MTIPNNIVEKLVFGADEARRRAKHLRLQGLHQKSAVQLERAKTMELVLLWIDNGVPLHKPPPPLTTKE